MTKQLLILSILILPLYTIRFRYGLIRTNLFEIVVMLSFITYLFQVKKQIFSQIYTFLYNKHSIFLWVISIGLLGMVKTQETIASLGVLKAYFIIPVIFVFLIDKVFLEKKMKLLPIWTMLAAASYISIISMIQVLVQYPEIHRPTAFFAIGTDPNVSQGGFANYLAMFLTPIIFLAGILFISTSHTKLFKIYIALSSLTLVGILLTQSITAYLTVGVLGSLAIGGLGRSYIISHSSRSTQKMGTFILTGAALFIIGMIILTMNLPKFQNLFDPMSRNSLSARLEIWHATSVMIKSNSLFGIGLADFPRVYQQVIPTLYFPPLEWLVPEPHNVFLAFWVHSGIFGLIIFIWILLRYIKLGGGIFQLIKSPKRALFFITLLSFYIQGILDTTFWKNDLAILFMLTILYIDTYLFIEEEVDT